MASTRPTWRTAPAGRWGRGRLLVAVAATVVAVAAVTVAPLARHDHRRVLPMTREPPVSAGTSPTSAP